MVWEPGIFVTDCLLQLLLGEVYYPEEIRSPEVRSGEVRAMEPCRMEVRSP